MKLDNNNCCYTESNNVNYLKIYNEWRSTEMVDSLDEVSNSIQGIISLANMRLNDLNNPNGSLSSEDIKSILYVAIQLLSYQYKDIRNIRDNLLLMEK